MSIHSNSVTSGAPRRSLLGLQEVTDRPGVGRSTVDLLSRQDPLLRVCGIGGPTGTGVSFVDQYSEALAQSSDDDA